MQGRILGVDAERGVLLDAQGRRLSFALSEWRSGGVPVAGQAVDFEEAGGEARSVFALPSGAAPTQSSTSVTLAWVALGCLALGFFVPFVPTCAAFVLGVVAAGRAVSEHDAHALTLARIAWIGALTLAVASIALLTALILFFSGMAGAFGWPHHMMGF